MIMMKILEGWFFAQAQAHKQVGFFLEGSTVVLKGTFYVRELIQRRRITGSPHCPQPSGAQGAQLPCQVGQSKHGVGQRISSNWFLLLQNDWTVLRMDPGRPDLFECIRRDPASLDIWLLFAALLGFSCTTKEFTQSCVVLNASIDHWECNNFLGVNFLPTFLF